MEDKFIYGIQQVGLGVFNAEESFKWYSEVLGVDVSVFDDCNTTDHMKKYMDGKAHERRTIMGFNLQGGGGYEFWQYMDRKPLNHPSDFRLGDLGINIVFVKSRNVGQVYMRLKQKRERILENGIRLDVDLKRCLYLKDPTGNILKIKECNTLYADAGKIDVGGIGGCAIGVKNIDHSLPFYMHILGYNKIVYDISKSFYDLYELPGGKERFRRVLLESDNHSNGGFGEFLGISQIELIQKLDSKPRKIYDGRYWGDIGFMHLCFDVRNLESHIKECVNKGYPFEVVSPETVKIGDTNCRWGYTEDNDGTLIGFFETKQIPLINKLGFKIDMTKRKPHKPLPRWTIKPLLIKRFQHEIK